MRSLTFEEGGMLIEAHALRRRRRRKAKKRSMSALGVRGTAYQREISAVQGSDGISPPDAAVQYLAVAGSMYISGALACVVAGTYWRKAGPSYPELLERSAAQRRSGLPGSNARSFREESHGSGAG